MKITDEEKRMLDDVRLVEPSATWPVHPVEPWLRFVGVNIERTREVQTYHYLPPARPDRVYRIWHDDDTYDEVERTDAEYADALAAYEKAAERYQKTGGVERIAGPIRPARFTFTTDSGKACTALWHEGEWAWLDVRW